MKLQFLSYGVVNDGGYRHETVLFKELSKQASLDCSELRKNRLYTDFFEHLNLLATSFFNCDADINLVVSRMGVSSLIRNIFNSKKTVIVCHYHDESDHTGWAMKIYFRFLFFMLRNAKKNKAAIVCVAPFWQNYFKNKIKNQEVPVFLFPNFFDPNIYTKFTTKNKQKRIHLGQFSDKNYNGILNLAVKLIDLGYEVYYSTLYKEQEELNAIVKIKHFPEFEDYLKQMAESQYSLALTGFNEGWNRVAHESILCGTSVIGFDKGGLGDLLRESNQFIAKTDLEVLDIITKENKNEPSETFVEKYRFDKAAEYIKPITKWMQF